MKRTTFKADALLLLVAVIWGTGFVAQRAGMKHVGPMTFTGIRFAIGSLVLLPVIFAGRQRRNETIPENRGPDDRSYLPRGMIVGVVLFIAVSLQQIGLVHTTAGKAGFITGLYVIIVPIIGLFLRHRVRLGTWTGAALATLGLYYLSVAGSFAVNRGDAYVLACAFVWATHVLIIGWLAPRTDPLRLAAVQFAIASALGLIAALLTENLTAESILAAKWPILYGGVFPVGIAFTLQIIGQRHAPPAHAAILLSLEAVFAAGAGALILAETLSLRELSGCALMLAGVLVSQIRRSRELAAESPPVATSCHHSPEAKRIDG